MDSPQQMRNEGLDQQEPQISLRSQVESRSVRVDYATWREAAKPFRSLFDLTLFYTVGPGKSDRSANKSVSAVFSDLSSCPFKSVLRFSFTVTLGEHGFEWFQIWLDGCLATILDR